MTTDMKTRSRVCWFDIVVSDIEHARSFYAPMFGWELKQLFDDYWYVDSADGDIGGGFSVSGGGLAADSRPAGGTALYVETDDLREACGRAVALGGSIEREPRQLPGDAGAYAQLRDLDGNVIGLWAAAL